MLKDKQMLNESEIKYVPCEVCKSVNHWIFKEIHSTHGGIDHQDAVCKICGNSILIFPNE